jgi:hypothetical protein
VCNFLIYNFLTQCYLPRAITNINNRNNKRVAYIQYIYICVCVCVCVCERERERDQLFETEFWDIMPSSPLKVNRRFGETYRLSSSGSKNKPSKKPE